MTHTVYALDSTTMAQGHFLRGVPLGDFLRGVDLCLALFPWARFRKRKGAVKLHTLLDSRAAIFRAFIHISEGKLHDVNILDQTVIVLAALAWVAVQVGDPVVLTASLAMMGGLRGFLVWNYPKGRIFLGDGGAYLVGFWLAELSVLLVVRNPDVSPWFPLMLLAYSVVDTLFSIYQRQYLHGHSAGRVDALHLHQLFYRYLVWVAAGSGNPQQITRRNSMVARYIWMGSALFFWTNTPALVAFALVFCVGYVWLYLRLLHWRAPDSMIIASKKA